MSQSTVTSKKSNGGFQRLAARHATVEDIVRGAYHVREGFTPNFVLTDWGMRLSRVRITGSVVQTYENEEGSFGSITIDDGTGRIRVKEFKKIQLLRGVGRGGLVEVVGKAREYNDERYLVPELIVGRDFLWYLLRRIEYWQFRKVWGEAIRAYKDGTLETKPQFSRFFGDPGDVEALELFFSEGGGKVGEKAGDGTEVKGKSDGEDEHTGEETLRRAMLVKITELDGGSGADYAELLGAFPDQVDELERMINEFLSEGVCYEPRPGKIKKI